MCEGLRFMLNNHKTSKVFRQCFVFMLLPLLINSCSSEIEQDRKNYDGFTVNKSHMIEVIGKLGSPNYRYDLGKNIPNKQCPVILTYIEHIENFSLLSPKTEYDNFHLYVFNTAKFLERYEKFEKCNTADKNQKCQKLLDKIIKKYSQEDALNRSCIEFPFKKDSFQKQKDDSIISEQDFIVHTLDRDDDNNGNNDNDSLEDYAD